MPPIADPDAVSHQDNVLLVSALALVSLGLTMVFISSHVMAQSQYHDPYFFIKRQSVYAVLGLAALFAGRFVNYRRYQRWVYPLLFLSLIMLILVFVPGIGVRVRSAARWLRLGPVTLQPSEFAKLAMVLFMAYSLARKQEKIKYFSIGFLPHMIVTGLFVGLIAKEPDFGTAMTLAAIVFVMLLVGGVRLAYVLGALSAVAGLATVLVLRDPKKFNRILSFLDPWKYGQDVGYQLKQSLLAIGSGGLFGLGPGQSRAKLFYLPDAHTDFILAIYSEELGLVGVLLILALFSLLVYRGLLLSLRAPDAFGSYLALGLTLLIGLQAGINMGVVTGLFPTKGLSLPFLSYGGSSLLATLLAVGILLNISSQIKRPKLPTEPQGEKEKPAQAS
jgi:cell division protein FtsW|uniref:Probable peptidoglycan glycosyltransferase FtsW n=1 Tax=Desulfobacca acetoxidans TaxID=60893 RepID=A0A7C3WIZ6_9BACT